MLRFKNSCSPSNDEDSTSSSDSYSGWLGCICSYNSDSSDWNDDNSYEDCKRVRIELENTHAELHRAIEKHDCRSIRKLLENGVKPCTTPISCFIVARRSPFILKKLLEIDPSGVNCQDTRGFTMLMLCSDDSSIYKLLYKYKPNINLINIHGDSIFFHLLKTRRFTSWKLRRLLELGLDVNSISGKGETALEVAFRNGIHHIGLIEAGAIIPPLDKDGESIIIEVIKDNRFRTMLRKVMLLSQLADYGVSINAVDENGDNTMHHLIKAQFIEIIRSKPEVRVDDILVAHLEDVLITLLDQNCEVMGLEMTFHRTIEMDCDTSFIEKQNILTAFIRYLTSVKYLKELVKRGLYSWKHFTKRYRELFPQMEEPMSPITACLSQLCTFKYSVLYKLKDILDTCKYLISIGVDVTHRSLGRNFQFEILGYFDEMNLTEELVYPDALFFIAQFRTSRTIWPHLKHEHISSFEELLRLLVRFWPYPPLYLFLIRMEHENWHYDPTNVSRDMTLLLKLLIKIGGAIPLGSRYYKSIKFLIQKKSKHGLMEWQELLTSFLQLDGGIPTLRSLSRAAFRATVKKTCPTGLDFSEYRVLCQGEMTPIPPEVVNYLEFKPSVVSNS